MSTPKPATVYDVAEAAGVSIATVSRVLRRPDDVRPDTRDRVLEAVRRLGYVPSASARGLAGQRTGVLGLLLPSFDDPGPDSDPGDAGTALPAGGLVRTVDDRATGAEDRPDVASLYFDAVVRGAEAEAWRRGFALLVATARAADGEQRIDDLTGRVDGMMVVAAVVPPAMLDRIRGRVPTVVVADTAAGGDAVDRVVVANEPGMHALVARMLADHPVRSIAYVAGHPNSSDERERRAGLDRAIADSPHPVRLRVEDGDFSEGSGRRAARRLLTDHDLPDAIVCANDQSALGVLAVLGGAGITVPDRVLVTGFDGVDAGRYSVPRLTTVGQPMLQLGRTAVAALTSRIEDRGAPARQWTLPVELLLRESSPPVA
jgi:LacI family transcriptional regulator